MAMSAPAGQPMYQGRRSFLLVASCSQEVIQYGGPCKALFNLLFYLTTVETHSKIAVFTAVREGCLSAVFFTSYRNRISWLTGPCVVTCLAGCCHCNRLSNYLKTKNGT